MTRSIPPSWARLALLALVGLAAAPASADEPPKLLGTDSEFAGMVDVPGGKCKIGVDWKYFKKLFWRGNRPIPPVLGGPRGQPIIEMLESETPEHTVELPPYAMDRYEVTNEQYRVFLDQSCKTSRFTTLQRNTLYKIAAEVYGENPTWWEMATVYSLNAEKLKTRKEEIIKKNPVRMKQVLAKYGVKTLEEVPERDRILAWAEFRLPENLALTVYSREVPETWKPWLFTGNEAEWKKIRNLPVEWVSGLDADAFAEWAGRHVPTEEEWEHAARGPKDWIYPWGDEWDCEKDRNRIYWSGTDAQPRGPAPAYKNQPLPVDSMPGTQSPFGCFHMLGNVTEWTSSPQERYPRSDSKYRWYGIPDGRVLRGHAYGAGIPYRNREILIRNTSRILVGPGGPILAMNAFGAVGFRCAKYMTPALDVLLARLRRVRKEGVLPEHLPLSGRNGYGVERNDYAPAGNEGPGKVFIRGRTRIIGVVPVTTLAHMTVKSILSASAKESAEPVIFAWLVWDRDLALDVLVPVPPKKAGPKPEQPATPDGEKDAGKPGTPPGKGEKSGERKKGEGPKPGPAAPEAPVGPTEERKSVHEENGLLVGMRNGRLAVFGLHLAGPKFLGYLPDFRENESAPLVVKGSPRKISNGGKGGKKASVLRSAGIDPATGRVRIRLALPLKSKSTRDAFGIDIVLHFQGSLAGTWRTLPEGK